MFDVKGVKISEVKNNTPSFNNVCDTSKFNYSRAVAVFSMCYSIIKSSGYWSLIAIIIKYCKQCYKTV